LKRWTLLLIAMVVAAVAIRCFVAKKQRASASSARVGVSELPNLAATPQDASIADARAPGSVDAGSAIEHRDGAGIAAADGRATPNKLSLVTVGGFVTVNLAGGQPTIRPYGDRMVGATRSVSGHVIRRSGQPVAGAIVLVDHRIDVSAEQIIAASGAITDVTGAFTVDRAPVGAAVAIAFADGEWSDTVELGDAPIELHMIGHGALTGRATYDGHGETFALLLQHQQFSVRRYNTDADGRIAITSLPPGTYHLSAGLAQAFGGGQSRTIERDIVIEDGHTTDVELEQKPGATVVVTGHPPDDVAPQGFVYWLFTGAAPASATTARAQAIAEHPPRAAIGGNGKIEPTQFHDVSPGNYTACAGLFDVRTMDALDAPFGCTVLVVHDTDTVRELDILLK
jgi:hypothetical protein